MYNIIRMHRYFSNICILNARGNVFQHGSHSIGRSTVGGGENRVRYRRRRRKLL